MKRLIMAVVVFGWTSLFVERGAAQDWTWQSHHHDLHHAQLAHREYHRYLYHLQAHRYPMSAYDHQRLHDHLNRQRFRDELDHRWAHYSGHFSPRYGSSYCPPSYYLNSRGFSIYFGR